MWWTVVIGNLSALCKCASLWGGVTATDKTLRAAVLVRNYAEAYRILHEVWYRAPDVPEIHKVEGWTTLCNLLDGTIPPPPGEAEDEQDANSGTSYR